MKRMSEKIINCNELKKKKGSKSGFLKLSPETHKLLQIKRDIHKLFLLGNAEVQDFSELKEILKLNISQKGLQIGLKNILESWFELIFQFF